MVSSETRGEQSGQPPVVDFSDDEEQALREFEATHGPELRNGLRGPTPTTVRFKIKDPVPLALEKTHLEIIVSEVEDQMVNNQV